MHPSIYGRPLTTSISTAMLVASSYESCKPYVRPMSTTEIDASSYETASTGEGTSA